MATPKYSSRLGNSLLSQNNDDVDIHDFSRSFTNEDGPAEDQSAGCQSKFCKVYSEHQLAFVISGAVTGICLGVGLSYWQPEDPTAKETALLWIGLLGNLFIRALKCVILPLVFCSITISVMDMLALGKVSTSDILNWTI